MKSFLAMVLFAGLTVVGSASAQSMSRAQRLGSMPQDTAAPELVCQVYPYPRPALNTCTGSQPWAPNTATLNFLNLPAGNYTYSWSIPPGRVGAKVGCTTGANCTVQFSALGNDLDATITATAFNTTTGQQFVLSAYISQPAVCGGGGPNGFHWC
ncbi:hypothetical protein [Dyella sp. ASV21]|uniref:hypothetical protein n=1 Tax=Dyella sp. ASV21 TaxID=2795114 RepID=UPI0018EC79F2|nr:hypothetical protein [Dyella sp. ASV21]